MQVLTLNKISVFTARKEAKIFGNKEALREIIDSVYLYVASNTDPFKFDEASPIP